jgi:two-component system catabolic regulation response regulator CreB
MKPRILVVEDEHGIADTLEFALRNEGFEPACVATGEAALVHLATQAAVALVILDIGLPDINGLEVFKRMRERHDVPVMFLTSRSHEIDRVVGLELGADDYISKPFSPRELVARVRAVLRRSIAHPVPAPPAPPVPPAAAAPFEVDDGRRLVRYYGEALDLSRYEYGLLCELVQRPGHVFTREVLLDRVWKDAESLDRTVDAHVKTLRAKLRRVTPTLEPIRTLRGAGYALAEDLPARRPP